MVSPMRSGIVALLLQAFNRPGAKSVLSIAHAFGCNTWSMATRVFVAGVLGGIVMFIWSFIAHDILPLGETGIREIPNEQGVLTAMQSNIGESSGLYFFPGLGAGPNPTRAQKSEAMKHRNDQLAANPSGILIYHPPGHLFSFGRSLGVEFCTEFAEAILAVSLLAQTAIASFGCRIWFVTVVGIIAALATNVSYWNWYGFPGNYTLAYMLIEVVGFLLVGIVAALVLGRRSATA